ncbi:MAG: MBL fold metallo-hydrolase [Spirochaetales bacterium]|nr:MBL fold metallo-hydrolase [Spirochaetales bacterium]
MKKLYYVPVIFLALASVAAGQELEMKSDSYKKDNDEIRLYFVGHASLHLEYNDVVIHVDPVMNEGDYRAFPKADIILVTHSHFDHLDKNAIALIEKDSTVIVLDPLSQKKLGKGRALANGQSAKAGPVGIQAVPAYNTSSGHTQFHPKGRDNGYVITLGSIKVYIAGDTEDIPEMAGLRDIDIAFLPMNQPYTMTPAQVRDAALMFKPKILYPYHFSNTDTSVLPELLKGSGTEVRIRDLD